MPDSTPATRPQRSPHYADESVTLHHGDCLDIMRELADSSVDAIVTDPPYGLGFMGREWDDLPPGLPWAQECLRVLKPGGHLLAFGGSRTWHRLACAVEDAGFEVRDSIAWLYGSGFPKSLDVSKAIDRAAGAEREVLGIKDTDRKPHGNFGIAVPHSLAAGVEVTAPATPDARTWQGWGTALKPAFEPIVVGRKPLAGTVAANVLAHGTGALNIAACRVSADGSRPSQPTSRGVAGSSPADSSDCTCLGPAGDPGNRTLSTSLPASSDDGPAGRSDPLASARPDESGCRPLPGSQVGCPSSGRSGDGPAREAAAPGQDSLPLRRDAGTSPVRCATCGRTRWTQSKPCPQDTTPDVERVADMPVGRWPANVLLDPSQSDELDRQSGTLHPAGNKVTGTAPLTQGASGLSSTSTNPAIVYGDSGGASRFFPTFRYEAKAPTHERPRIGTGTEAGVHNNRCAKCGRTDLSGTPCTCPEPEWIPRTGGEVVAHPTVKPLDLMRWLVRLVTPPGGLVLEPFAGSGTTAEACVIEGFRCLAIEREATYLPLIVARLSKPIQVDLFGGAA